MAPIHPYNLSTNLLTMYLQTRTNFTNHTNYFHISGKKIKPKDTYIFWQRLDHHLESHLQPVRLRRCWRSDQEMEGPHQLSRFQFAQVPDQHFSAALYSGWLAPVSPNSCKPSSSRLRVLET